MFWLHAFSIILPLALTSILSFVTVVTSNWNMFGKDHFFFGFSFFNTSAFLCTVSYIQYLKILFEKKKIFIHLLTILNILLMFFCWIFYLPIQLINAFRNNTSHCWTVFTHILKQKICGHSALYYRKGQYVLYIWSPKNLFQMYLNSIV